MKHRTLYMLLAMVLLASLVLTACAQPTTPAVVATPEPPTATPEPVYEGMKVEAPDCEYGGEFKSIEAVDQYTVKFTLCTPDPAFPSKVAFAVFAIQDKDYLDANGGDSAKMSEKPNGTGPYVVKEWVRGDHITFEANPNYWGDQPKTKTVIFRWSSEAAQRLLELQSGTVQGIDNPAPEDFATIEGDSNLKLNPRPALNIFYIGLNNTIPPFDNEKVRQAVAMSIDKQRIVEQFYPAGSSTAEQFAPPALQPGYTDGYKWYDYDPEGAKKLLAEAGYADGFEVTMSFRNVVRGYLPNPKQVIQDLQAQLADVGIKVTINEMESGAFLQSVADGKEAIYMLGWGADYPDATNFYDYHFNETGKRFGTPFDDVVAEMKIAASLVDPAERQKHYDKVNELIKQHVPMIPVAHGGSGTAWLATVGGNHSSPLGNEYFGVVEQPGADQFVWMQNAEPIMLWCADETDGETLRACEQVYEALLSYEIGGVAVQPGLAEKWEANAELTQWTFYLREGVTFHNGAALDANDVVATYAAQWDFTSPNHKGNTSQFEYFGGFFGTMLNAPKE
jgi:ABC-type transport system substrate-binding protein